LRNQPARTEQLQQGIKQSKQSFITEGKVNHSRDNAPKNHPNRSGF
jgi:hypothetical protein